MIGFFLPQLLDCPCTVSPHWIMALKQLVSKDVTGCCTTANEIKVRSSINNVHWACFVKNLYYYPPGTSRQIHSLRLRVSAGRGFQVRDGRRRQHEEPHTVRQRRACDHGQFTADWSLHIKEPPSVFTNIYLARRRSVSASQTTLNDPHFNIKPWLFISVFSHSIALCFIVFIPNAFRCRWLASTGVQWLEYTRHSRIVIVWDRRLKVRNCINTH